MGEACEPSEQGRGMSWNIEFGYSTRCGKKHHGNQDIVANMEVVNRKIIAVFDGHGKRGGEIATRSADILLPKLMDIFPADMNDERILQAFQETQTELQSEFGPKDGGTTAACVSLAPNDHGGLDLMAINLGDSHIVLSQGNMVKRLSEDHNVRNEAEQKRIRDAGAFLDNKGRIGGLCPTRSLGNEFAKNFIIQVPYITREEISSDGVLIVATDGLWDVMTDYSAVDYYRSRLPMSTLTFWAMKTVSKAQDLGSVDDISCCLINWTAVPRDE